MNESRDSEPILPVAIAVEEAMGAVRPTTPSDIATWQEEFLLRNSAVARKRLAELPPAFALRNLSPLCNQVADYIERGWVPLPVPGGTKRPNLPWKRFQELKPTTAEYLDLFSRSAFDHRLGVAIVLGRPSNLIVVDHDSPEALEELRSQLGGLPKTVRAQSGSGKAGRGHFYFSAPEFVTRARSTPWHGELEIRGDGGLIVAPPSLHVSGNKYRWMPGQSPSEVALAKLPAAILRALSTSNTRRQQPVPRRRAIELPPDRRLKLVSEETRRFLNGDYSSGPNWNCKLFLAACDMSGCGFEEADATARLLFGAQPWTDADEEAAVRTIESAFSEPRSPARTAGKKYFRAVTIKRKKRKQ